MWLRLLPINAAMLGLAVAVSVLFGLAALWAVGGRAHWLARLGPAALLLAALVPIGAYEPLVLFGAQVAVVIGGHVVAALVAALRRRHAGARPSRESPPHDTPATNNRPHFGLKDMLLAVLLVGTISAIVRFGPPLGVAFMLGVGWSWYALAGAILGLITVAGAWIATGRGRWYVRAGLVAGVYLIVCIAAHWFGVYLWAAGMPLAGVMIGVLLLNAAGWGFRRVAPPTGMQGRPAAAPSRRRVRRLSQALVGLAALAIVTGIGPLYYELLPSAPRPVEPAPEPNGYSVLVSLATKLNWSAWPSQDVETASAAACAQFVNDNAQTLALVREALELPSRAPALSGPTLPPNNLTDIQVLRSLARALAMEAKLAESEGRISDAVAIYTDIVALGDAASRGGVLVFELVGIAIKGVDLGGMEPLVARLDAAELAHAQERLAVVVGDSEPIDQMVEREQLFAAQQNGFGMRVRLVFNDSMLQPAIDAAMAARMRSDASLHLMLTEMAVRRYVLDNGAPPESLAALVPKYLKEVPRDAFGDGPLVYRTTDDGYLLYSVGINGTDDGGQRAWYEDAVISGNGDYFLNAPKEADQAVNEAENEADATTDEPADAAPDETFEDG